MRADELKSLAERFERASRAYAELHEIERDADWFLLKMQEELGELTQAWLRHTKRNRQRGDDESSRVALADEADDLLGHVLLLAHRLDLDLAAAIARKWRFDPATSQTS
jgi:NTP pyrophosphatase (non-canonical NTP hydrolase)